MKINWVGESFTLPVYASLVINGNSKMHYAECIHTEVPMH